MHVACQVVSSLVYSGIPCLLQVRILSIARLHPHPSVCADRLQDDQCTRLWCDIDTGARSLH